MSGRDLFTNGHSNGPNNSGYVRNNVFYQSTVPVAVQHLPQRNNNGPYYQQQQQPVPMNNNNNNGMYLGNGGYARPPPAYAMSNGAYQQQQQSQTPPAHWSKTLSAQIDAKPRPPSAMESITKSGLGAPSTTFVNNENNASNNNSEPVEIMWEARRARERAEQEAEQKLIDAVCKASLLEFTEKERALQTYESELVARDADYHSGSTRLQQERVDAEQRKRDAMQRVIDSKQKAQLMAAKAREATGLYEQKNAERIAKLADLDELNQHREREGALLAAQQKKADAIRKREDAERRAQEAREKAEAMRRRAIDAAQLVRAQSRKQIETELTHEEAQRQLDQQRKMQEIDLDRTTARDRTETAARKAVDAQRRAEELRARAEQARRRIQQSQSDC